MIEQQNVNARLFELTFGKRPRQELYDCRDDPHQLHNLAFSPKCKVILAKLSDWLTAHLRATGDPRETTGERP
jgi:N-sulfoglucosamine sulfohydrolase